MWDASGQEEVVGRRTFSGMRDRRIMARPIKSSSWWLLAFTLVVLQAAAVPANARTRSLDLRDSEVKLTNYGFDVSEAGDVNGDGAADLLVRHCKTTGAEVFVALGPLAQGSLVSPSDDIPGFWIRWRAPEETPGYCDPPHPDAAGDVNGDGIGDILVGVPNATNGRGRLSGVSYVVFGKEQPNDVDLNSFDSNTQGSAGYRIDGAQFFDRAGEEVVGLGDQNHDGLDDVAIGATFSASTYVVFGRTATHPVDLLLFDMDLQSDQGYRIDTPRPHSNSDFAVGALGDVNADGIPDVGVGVSGRNDGRGKAYIVYGKSDSSVVDARNLGGAGFKVVGAARGDDAGHALDGAGDVNGDGIDDFIVGEFDPYTGAAWVIFGSKKQDVLYLAEFGSEGFRIAHRNRETKAVWVGQEVAGAGDVNGDGLDDVIVGANGSSFRNRQGAGAAYVVYGKRESSRVQLADLGSGGYRLDGARSRQRAGYSVAGPGDLNGDGTPDVAVGSNSGLIHVVFSSAT